MASRDAWGMAFCCGTSSVSRVSTLLQIGGVPTQSVTEDYLLTLRLDEAGYRTVYLNERLSTGLAPEGLKEYATQRSRWCLGLLQICRGRYSPFRLGSPLSLRHRFGLLESFLYWAASYPFRLLCVLIPILYWVFSIRAVNADLGDAIYNYLPYFVSQTATTIWLNGGRMLPVLAETSQLLIVSDILRAIWKGLARTDGHKFEVTAKGGQRNRRTIQWRPLAGFVLFALATVLGVVSAFILDQDRLIEGGGRCAWSGVGTIWLCS